MATRSDILLFDREGRRLLVAEVKNKRNTSPKWAAELRRNLLAHEGFRHAEFFLVLTPDHLYFWGECPPSPGRFPRISSWIAVLYSSPISREPV
jgi:hypothetical protein